MAAKPKSWISSLVVALVATTVLAGCAPEMTSGEVISKKHESERTYFLIMPIYAGQSCVRTKTANICTSRWTWIPYLVHDDEDWILTIDDGQRKGKVYVSAEDYEQVAVGDHWEKADGQSANDPVKKLRKASKEESQDAQRATDEESG